MLLNSAGLILALVALELLFVGLGRLLKARRDNGASAV
jgi:hypothetical protein